MHLDQVLRVNVHLRTRSSAYPRKERRLRLLRLHRIVRVEDVVHNLPQSLLGVQLLRLRHLGPVQPVIVQHQSALLVLGGILRDHLIPLDCVVGLVSTWTRLELCVALLVNVRQSQVLSRTALCSYVVVFLFQIFHS